MNNEFDYSDYQEKKQETKKNTSKGKFLTDEKENTNNVNNINKRNLILSIVFILVIIGLLVSFVVFKMKSKESSTNPSNTPTETNKPKPEKGVTIIDVNSKTRPYAIMINCHNSALPQAGLQDAYLVYELMVEGGITRMMALFKDKDVSKIGSIRSARTQYLDYVYENDAIYVHAGGAKDALNRISSEKISDIDADGAYGFRDTSLKRPWEHTLFTSTTLLKKGVADKSMKTTTNISNLLTYQADPLEMSLFQDKKTATNISIKYSDYRTTNYVYDQEKQVYLRSMNNTKNIDLVTGKQYEVKNIIVYGVNYSNYTYNGYSGYQKIENVGRGEGYYITNGYAIPIIWEKSSKNSQTVYKVKATLEKLVVHDGNTYIQIYPSNSGSLTIH